MYGIRQKRIGRAYSRRTLLKSLGASTVLSPFLPLLNATGQEATFPKRLLLFYVPDGTAAIDHGGEGTDWKPAGTETDFTLQPIHQPLTPFIPKLVVPWGMRFSAGGAGQEHAFGMSGLWSGATLNQPSGDANFDGGNGNRTGWGSGPSIDQVVAEAFGPESPYTLPTSDGETPYRSVELGVQTAEPHSMARMIYSGNNAPIHPEANPQAAFDRLFANVTPTDPNAAPVVDDGSSAKQRASIDHLLADVERLRPRVASSEYEKIDAHLEGLKAIERRIGSTTIASVGCTVPDASTIPSASSGGFGGNSAAFPDEAKAMMDIAVHALACDLTRVASVQLSRGFSGIVHDWVGATQGHHTISHLDGDNRPTLQAIDTWYAEQFAYMLGQLDSISEGDGTLLDNTLVVWGREMGQTNHRMQPAPFIMAGGARGGLVTGRALDYDREPHAKLLVSIGQLMGLDINSFGDRDPDSGPLPGLLG